MRTHPIVRLTPLCRKRLLRGHIDHVPSLAPLFAQAGISVRTAYKWLARYRSGGAAAMADRRSVRRTQRRTHDPLQLQSAVCLRHERSTLHGDARVLAAQLSIVGRLLKAVRVGRLKNLQPAEPVQQRYTTNGRQGQSTPNN